MRLRATLTNLTRSTQRSRQNLLTLNREEIVKRGPRLASNPSPSSDEAGATFALAVEVSIGRGRGSHHRGPL
ncbi:O6-methylguanine-DNA methyltransferase [Schaalia cardiffensis F0333]|uniref:O6-methylguanine-DNA methyltransferase n=1 Tax=Schaalia cardiffensis F0333 TaxID=888050 RepID=N6X0X2_9ACTO|nr:O6-methylguanine-DNA methyltransferase [Schaalia cardiffensis F0333]